MTSDDKRVISMMASADGKFVFETRGFPEEEDFDTRELKRDVVRVARLITAIDRSPRQTLIVHQIPDGPKQA